MKENLLEKLERENLKIASFSKRVVAYFIDHFIITCMVFIIFYDDFQNGAGVLEIRELAMKFYFVFFALEWSYHIIFTYFYGASLGKMACKILILNEELLDKPNLTQSCLRATMRIFSNMFFMLGFAWALSNVYLKTWQDYLAKTVVVDVA